MRSFHFKLLVLITLGEIDMRKLYKFQIAQEIRVIVIPRFTETLSLGLSFIFPGQLISRKCSKEILFTYFFKVTDNSLICYL